jgi:hypothetical protein
MSRYLVVAHQTAERVELLEELRLVASRDGEAEFDLVVPATPVRHLLVWEEAETLAVARRRAVEAAAWLVAAGLPVAGARVGDGDPLLAIADALRDHRGYAAVIVSTLPPGMSRWLRLDLVNRARRLFPRHPVTHVLARRSGEPNEKHPCPTTVSRP